VYQATACDSGIVESAGALMGLTTLALDPELDFMLFSTIQSSPTMPCLQLDRRMPAVGERIYIPHQPNTTSGMKLSIESDQDPGGFCAVQAVPVDGATRRSDLGHRCDTQFASLGAPIISGATQRVVGIQHFGNCSVFNRGARMDLIYPKIEAVLDSCSNGVACEPFSGGRCDCNAVCDPKERRFVDKGGICPDCS